MRTHILMLSASALAVAWAGSALAQSKSDDMLETVVVTAQRRSENLMQTPIAATVLSGDQLLAKNVLRVEDLQFVAPAITVNNFGQGINFNIRGIGKGEHNTTPTGVITYRDGTPTFPGYIAEEPYYDIADIEVLRGPQGTFVGQNATGGAVVVTTNNPHIGGGYDGYILANAGNYAEVGVQGAVNIPISDTFAARVSFFADRRDQFADITNNGQEYKGINSVGWAATRLSLLWRPTDNWTFSFKTDWDYLDNGGYPAAPYNVLCKHYAAGGLGCGAATPNPYYTGDPLKLTANDPSTGLDRMTRNTLKVDYSLPDGTIVRSVSSYQIGSTEYGSDLDGTDRAGSIFYDMAIQSIWTQEINVISPSDQRITWILGAFTQADKYDWTKPYRFVIDTGVPHGDPRNHPSGNPLAQYKFDGVSPNSSWAAFGQVTVKLWGGLEAQFGARWSANVLKNDIRILQYGLALNDIQKTKSYSFDYKGALNWTINDNNFLYGFIATGYKPGGHNFPVATTPPYNNMAPFGPERVMSYEAGYKGTFADGHVRTQLDAFYNDYKHFQVSISYPNLPTFGYELNAPNPTKMYGLEAEMEAVFGGFSFNAGLGWMHSQVGGFWAQDPRAPVTYPFGLTLPCDPKTGPNFHANDAVLAPFGLTWTYGNTTCFNLQGHPQTYAPSLTGSLGIEYKFDLGNGDTLTPRASYSHTGPQWATLFDNRNYGDRLGVRNLVGLQLEWKHGEYVITAYSSNLTDSHYVAAMNSNSVWGGPPRQYGIRLLKVF